MFRPTKKDDEETPAPDEDDEREQSRRAPEQDDEQGYRDCRGGCGTGAQEWSDHIPLGKHLRLQAELPYRAISMELVPGLFIVAEIRDSKSRFAGREDAKAVARDALTATDAALDKVFPGRAAAKQRALNEENEAKRQKALAAPPAQRALPAPAAPSQAVTPAEARWATPRDEDDDQ